MKIQKIIFWVLGLGIIIGLGFIAVKSNNKEPEKIKEPTEDIVWDGGLALFPEFEKTVSFKLNDKFTFADGLEVTLKEINDSRCPKGVQCFWAGELAGLFSLSGGTLTAPKEIRMGTINNTSMTWEGYTFSLKNATENSIDIEIVKN